jgi:hypothetical protein
MVVAWIGTPLILNHENMHSVWNSIEWVGNTLLFLLAGSVLGSHTYRVESSDIASVIVVYLLLQIIRIAMIFCFYPLLTNLGDMTFYTIFYDLKINKSPMVFRIRNYFERGRILILVRATWCNKYGSSPCHRTSNRTENS